MLCRDSRKRIATLLRIFIAASLFFLAGQAPVFAQIGNIGQGDAPRTDENEGPPIVFYADLSADEESAVTVSPGVGHLECILDRKTLKFTWKLTYSGLTSPVIGAALHGPQTPGGEAGVLVDIGTKGLSSPIEGSANLTEGQLEYLLVGRMYVQVRTTKFPVGEIRGQLNRQRPKSPNS